MMFIKPEFQLIRLRSDRLTRFSKLELFSCSGTYRGYVAQIKLSTTFWLAKNWWFTDLDVATKTYEDWMRVQKPPDSLPTNSQKIFGKSFPANW